MIGQTRTCVKIPRNFSKTMRVAKEGGQDTGWKRAEGRKAQNYPRPKIKRPRVRLQLRVLRSESHRPFPIHASAESGSVVIRTKDESHVRNEFCSLDETVLTESRAAIGVEVGKSEGKIAKQLSRLYCPIIFPLRKQHIFRNTVGNSFFFLFIYFSPFSQVT